MKPWTGFGPAALFSALFFGMSGPGWSHQIPCVPADPHTTLEEAYGEKKFIVGTTREGHALTIYVSKKGSFTLVVKLKDSGVFCVLESGTKLRPFVRSKGMK